MQKAVEYAERKDVRDAVRSRWEFPFFMFALKRLGHSAFLEFGHLLASSCLAKCT